MTCGIMDIDGGKDSVKQALKRGPSKGPPKTALTGPLERPPTYGSRAPSRGPLAYSVGRPAGAEVKSALSFLAREIETENSKSSEIISSKISRSRRKTCQ
jgi:hypothetical protein